MFYKVRWFIERHIDLIDANDWSQLLGLAYEEELSNDGVIELMETLNDAGIVSMDTLTDDAKRLFVKKFVEQAVFYNGVISSRSRSFKDLLDPRCRFMYNMFGLDLYEAAEALNEANVGFIVDAEFTDQENALYIRRDI